MIPEEKKGTVARKKKQPVQVMVVEDSPTQAEQLKHMLEENGYHALVAESGKKALELLHEQKPSLVISDIVMPEMGGYELCSKIKNDKELEDLPVVLVTALSDPVDIIKGLECGANHFVIKPYDESELLSRIQHVIINQEISRREKTQLGLEIVLVGKRYCISSERKQILDLLLSTYETAVGKNLELLKAQEQLKTMNERLDEMVKARTAEMVEEIVMRRGAEAKLANALWERDNIMETIPDILYILDIEARMMNWNKRLEEVTGYSKEELLGKSVLDFFLEEEKTTVAVAIEAVFEKGQSETAATLLTKDGRRIPYHLTGALLKGKKGKVIGITGVGRDITEMKMAEEEIRLMNVQLIETLGRLRNAQEQAFQQERLRALGTMAAGIAHDFNNALSPILGFSDLLLTRPETLKDYDKVKHALEVIHMAANDAGKVVSRLREFYRPREEGEIFQPLDLMLLVDQTLSLTRPKWKDQAFAEGVTIRIEKDLQKVPLILGSQAELRDVLTNLIFNAVDAMPKGGIILISTCEKENQVILKVSDTGTGMTNEVRWRCFEPFFSTKGEKGTGLGLSVVFGIVQRHQGTIEAESEPGKGTSFIMTFPVPSEGKPHPVQLKKQERALRSLRVLLVDDEIMVREAMKEYLLSDGHAVETAGSGREGLEKFHSGRFDLVITDKGMPNMSGDIFARFVKQAAPQKPVIMLTGFGEMMSAAGEHPQGVDLILNKPVTLKTLREALVSLAEIAEVT